MEYRFKQQFKRKRFPYTFVYKISVMDCFGRLAYQTREHHKT